MIKGFDKYNERAGAVRVKRKGSDHDRNEKDMQAPMLHVVTPNAVDNNEPIQKVGAPQWRGSNQSNQNHYRGGANPKKKSKSKMGKSGIKSWKQFEKAQIKEQEGISMGMQNGVAGSETAKVEQEILNIELQIQQLNDTRLKKIQTDLATAKVKDAEAQPPASVQTVDGNQSGAVQPSQPLNQ